MSYVGVPKKCGKQENAAFNHVHLRRGRDLNPRPDKSRNGFQDRRIQPLCHLSK